MQWLESLVKLFQAAQNGLFDQGIPIVSKLQAKPIPQLSESKYII
jgi:hypothetical protein